MTKNNIFSLFLSIGFGFVVGGMAGEMVAEENYTGLIMFIGLFFLVCSLLAGAERDRKNMTGE